MKKIFVILILSLYHFSTSWSDDLRDIQIEGISLGDNAVDFFSKKVLEQSTNEIPGTDNKFSFAAIYDMRFEGYINVSNFSYKNFDVVEVYFLSNDKNYKIYGLAGGLSKNIGKRFKTEKECIKKKDEMASDIIPIFKDAVVTTDSSFAPIDKAKQSKFYRTFIKLSSESKFYEVEVACIYYKGEISKTFESNVGISLFSDEMNQWKSTQKLFNPQ